LPVVLKPPFGRVPLAILFLLPVLMSSPGSESGDTYSRSYGNVQTEGLRGLIGAAGKNPAMRVDGI
jgi:hypothetical protein